MYRNVRLKQEIVPVLVQVQVPVLVQVPESTVVTAEINSQRKVQQSCLRKQQFKHSSHINAHYYC